MGSMINSAFGKEANMPAAPNYEGIAERQAMLASPDIYNQYGQSNTTWTGEGKDRRATIRQSLTPEEQAIFGQHQDNRLLGTRLAAEDPYSGTGFQLRMKGFDEQFNPKRQQVAESLMARGLRPGTEAYNREVGNLDAERSKFADYAQLSNAQEMRNRIATLMQQYGGNIPTPQYQSPDLMGAAQSQYQAAANAQSAQNQMDMATTQGLFSLGAGALAGGVFGGRPPALPGTVRV